MSSPDFKSVQGYVLSQLDDLINYARAMGAECYEYEIAATNANRLRLMLVRIHSTIETMQPADHRVEQLTRELRTYNPQHENPDEEWFSVRSVVTNICGTIATAVEQGELHPKTQLEEIIRAYRSRCLVVTIGKKPGDRGVPPT